MIKLYLGDIKDVDAGLLGVNGYIIKWGCLGGGCIQILWKLTILVEELWKSICAASGAHENDNG